MPDMDFVASDWQRADVPAGRELGEITAGIAPPNDMVEVISAKVN